MGSLLSILSIASLFGVGIGATFAPEALAKNYGLALAEGDDAGRGFVRALGARDAIIGAIALASVLRGDRDGVRRTLGITTFLAVADFTIVARARGLDAWTSLAIHGSGIVGLALAAAIE
jgi:hypothetical protein